MRPAILFGNFLIINISIAKCLEKTCHEIIEPKLNDTQCGLRPGRSTFSLSSKFLRYLGNMQKTSTHALSTSRKHTTGLLVKSLVECFGRTVLTTVCYWPSSHCIPAHKFLSLSAELNHNRSPLVLYCDKQGRIQGGGTIAPPKT